MPLLADTGRRRLGRFRIAFGIVDGSPADALAALDGCVVLRAEALLGAGAIEYEAWHPDFAQVEPGEEMPGYEAVLSGGRRVRWEPRPGGRLWAGERAAGAP